MNSQDALLKADENASATSKVGKRFLTLSLLAGIGAGGYYYSKQESTAEGANLQTVGNYWKVEEGCVNGHNMVLYMDVSVETCEAFCDATPGCKAFEYGHWYGAGGASYRDRDCQLQDSADFSNCNGGGANLDVYIKPNQYFHESEGCVNGYNLELFEDSTVEECQEICDLMPECMAFEFGTDHGGGGSYENGDC